MIVTKNELRDIVEQCRRSRPEKTATLDDEGDPSSDVGNVALEELHERSSTEEENEIRSLINGCLDVKLEPLSTLHESIESLMSITGSIDERLRKLADLYDQMVAYKNRSTMILTRDAEMYERIKSLKVFCQEEFRLGEEEEKPSPTKRMVQRISNLERISLKNLNSFGIVPIWPDRNDEFLDDEHRVVAEVPVQKSDDVVGTVAECLKMGLRHEGVVSRSAEVVLFKPVDASKASEKISSEN